MQTRLGRATLELEDGIMRFRDRTDAGEQLAERLARAEPGAAPIVLGLPRGGVVVAGPVARALGAPLDVLVIRKLGSPANAEYAVGAIGEGGVRVVDAKGLRGTGVTERSLAAIERQEFRELQRRTALYRAGRLPLNLSGRTAVLVDDGVATGATARAACLVSRAIGARRTVLAVPVAPRDWTDGLADVADELIALQTPSPFFAVGQWYERFGQTSDDEVLATLRDHPGTDQPHQREEDR
ncbi:phosphoribosyltransferase [Lysobacter korlensis]|uniref:Phosphoribosyltransferase n=1 Tax=Lysobacter korlensis TaxID=553636 RepID=A0ABV6RXC0_9GAMM